MKSLLILAFCLMAHLSFAQSDSLTVGCIAKDTTLTVYTSPTGAKFIKLYSPAKRKFYRVYFPRIKD